MTIQTMSFNEMLDYIREAGKINALDPDPNYGDVELNVYGTIQYDGVQGYGVVDFGDVTFDTRQGHQVDFDYYDTMWFSLSLPYEMGGHAISGYQDTDDSLRLYINPVWS